MSRGLRLVAAVVGAALLVTLGYLAWRALRPREPPFAVTLACSGDARASSLPLTPGARLGPGERVDLAEGARATLSLPGGDQLALAGPAALELEALAPDRPAELWLRRGTLTVAQPAPRATIVYTRHATLTARGARFEVAADERSTVVRLGRGQLAADLPGGVTLDLSPGERLSLGASAPARAPDPSPLAPE